jgi:hypothetical protein
MPEIRSLAEGDLAAVTRMLAGRMPTWDNDERFLRETVLEHPWASPEFPSLVAVNAADEVVGFIGVQVRRLIINDQAAVGVCCSHLAVSGDPSAGPAGALLLSQLLRGEQAVTWSDSANEPVVRMWRAFGGQLDHARACDWMLVLRPARWIGSIAGSVGRRRSIDRSIVPVGALPVHAISSSSAQHDVSPLDSRISGQDASPAVIAERLQGFAAKWSVAVDHDANHLRHQFELIERMSGPLTSRLVLRDDTPIGWYVYRQQPGKATRVLHLAATDKNADAVLGELVEHSRGTGTSVLAGRLEPHLDQALRKWLPVVGFARNPVIHAHDPEVRAALASGSSLLTRLDSEWFVR